MMDNCELTIFDGLENLPHFNPDTVEIAETVLCFKQQLLAADGVIICTPEYAHGVPGSLKNAIDWTVGTGEFSGKPTVLITASTDGQFAHTALLETLRVIEAGNVQQLNLLVQFIKTKVNAQHQIIHQPTLTAIQQLLHGFMQTIYQPV